MGGFEGEVEEGLIEEYEWMVVEIRVCGFEETGF